MTEVAICEKCGKPMWLHSYPSEKCPDSSVAVNDPVDAKIPLVLSAEAIALENQANKATRGKKAR